MSDRVGPRLWVAGPVKELRAAAATGLVNALVTNPTVLADWCATDPRPAEVIAAELAEATCLPVYIQLRGPDCASLVRQATQLSQVHPLLLPKLPATGEGFAACRQLPHQAPALITGIASLTQVFAARAAGARFICPYLARLRDAGVAIAELFDDAASLGSRFVHPMELVPASVRTVEDVDFALQHGATGVIVFTGLFRELLNHPLTEQALEAFEQKDWDRIKTRLQ